MLKYFTILNNLCVCRVTFHSRISSGVVNLTMSHPSFLPFRQGQRAANLQIQVHQNHHLLLHLNQQAQKVTEAHIAIQKMKEKTKWRMKTEGKIGCWTLLIWKILKHYTDSGTSNICTLRNAQFTYTAELS